MHRIRSDRQIAAVGLLASLASACAGEGTGPVSGAEEVRLSTESLILWVGDTVRLSAEVLDRAGRRVDTDVQWGIDSPVAAIDPSGLVTALTRGSGTVRASAAGLTEEAALRVQPVIRGRVHAVGPAGVDELRVSWLPEPGLPVDEVRVRSDGTFALRPVAADARGQLLVDAGGTRTYHPFLLPFDLDDPVHAAELEAMDIVMIPLRWTIEQGEYAGQVIDTNLDRALDDDVGPSTFYFGRAETGGARYEASPATWPIERFPALVAFDHRWGGEPVTEADSIAIWGVLNRLEEIFGIDLFEPGVAEPGWWTESPFESDFAEVPGTIRVVFHAGRWGAGLGTDETATWERDLGPFAAGGRFESFILHRRLLTGGSLLIEHLAPTPLPLGVFDWPEVLKHEVTHLIGTGHTCRIPSHQGSCGDPDVVEPTPADVAYLELLREVTRVEREHDTFFGLMPALIGERRRIHGLPALPTEVR